MKYRLRGLVTYIEHTDWAGDRAYPLPGKKVTTSVRVGNLEKVVRETLLEIKGKGKLKKGYVDVYSDVDVGPYHDTGWIGDWYGDNWNDWDDWNDSNSSKYLMKRKKEGYYDSSPYYDTVSYHDYPGYYDKP